MQRDEARRHRRARLMLSGGLAVLVIVVIVAVLVVAHNSTGPDRSARATHPGHDGAGPAGGAEAAKHAPTQHGSRRGGHAPRHGTGSSGGWDVAAEDAIATKPMISFPTDAIYPHALSSRTAGAPITLPKPTETQGNLVDAGFPATPKGALAKLAALDEAGLEGLDPASYKAAYNSVALPGAPAATSTYLYRGLQKIRSGARLPAEGSASKLHDAGYTVSEGLIKGTADGGRFVVVCVLGTLHGSGVSDTVQAGVGDCEAFRRVDGAWLISPTKEPATAPSAWPGSAESVKAGYRQVVSK